MSGRSRDVKVPAGKSCDFVNLPIKTLLDLMVVWLHIRLGPEQPTVPLHSSPLTVLKTNYREEETND